LDATTAHPPIVLVVEDHEDSREMYCQYLQSAGYWALGAATASEALHTAQEYHPDVVVTDISMPGMDGWQFAEALREADADRRIGIIAVSGWSSDEALEPNTRRANVDVVMTKPCLPDELLREIRKLLARGRLARVRGNTNLMKARELQERHGKLKEDSAKHRKAPTRNDR
jgi:DNA-binding response OmpR family regulator